MKPLEENKKIPAYDKPYSESELSVLAKVPVESRSGKKTRRRLKVTITECPELAEWASVLMKKFHPLEPNTKKSVIRI